MGLPFACRHVAPAFGSSLPTHVQLSLVSLLGTRALGLPVVMIDRPAIPARPELSSPQEVLDRVAHSGTDLGV